MGRWHSWKSFQIICFGLVATAQLTGDKRAKVTSIPLARVSKISLAAASAWAVDFSFKYFPFLSYHKKALILTAWEDSIISPKKQAVRTLAKRQNKSTLGIVQIFQFVVSVCVSGLWQTNSKIGFAFILLQLHVHPNGDTNNRKQKGRSNLHTPPHPC